MEVDQNQQSEVGFLNISVPIHLSTISGYFECNGRDYLPAQSWEQFELL